MRGTSREKAWQSRWDVPREERGTCQESGQYGFVHRRAMQVSWDILILEYLCWYPQLSIWLFCHQRHGRHPISAAPRKNRKWIDIVRWRNENTTYRGTQGIWTINKLCLFIVPRGNPVWVVSVAQFIPTFQQEQPMNYPELFPGL